MIKIDIRTLSSYIGKSEANTYTLLKRHMVVFSEKNACTSDKHELLDFMFKYRKGKA